MYLLDRIAGCLLGTCAADALGAPVEGVGPEEADEWVGVLRLHGFEKIIEATGIGQYTDDGQLSRELMLSVVNSGGFDPADFAARVLGLYRAGAIVGIGQATAAACERMASGIVWDAAGEHAPAAGNGTAMRAGPIGFLHADAPDRRAVAAHEQGFCTHRDPRCSAGSVGVATGVAILAALPRSAAVDPVALCAAMAAAMRPWHAAFADLVEALPATLTLPDRDALDRIAAAGRVAEEADAQPAWSGISPFVVPTLLWSLRSFLRHPQDYADAVLLAISGGGDADTTAAVTGALAGSRVGLSGIPGPLVNMVHDDGAWDAAALVDLAERFRKVACPDGPLRDG